MGHEKTCYNCAYRGEVAGSAHIRCKFDWNKSTLKLPQADQHAIENCWWRFPVNYDPVWMEGECPAHSDEIDPDMVKESYRPMIELLGLLR